MRYSGAAPTDSGGHPILAYSTGARCADPGWVVVSLAGSDGRLHMPPPHAAVLTPHSLYRGITPPLIGVTPIFAISFWVS